MICSIQHTVYDCTRKYIHHLHKLVLLVQLKNINIFEQLVKNIAQLKHLIKHCIYFNKTLHISFFWFTIINRCVFVYVIYNLILMQFSCVHYTYQLHTNLIMYTHHSPHLFQTTHTEDLGNTVYPNPYLQQLTWLRIRRIGSYCRA